MEEDRRVKKVRKPHRPFSEIPCAVLCDILGRVPIKTCLNCMLVCKEWYRIVTSPEFSSVRHQHTTSQFSTLLYASLLGADDVGLNFNFLELEKALDSNDLGHCFVSVDDVDRFKQRIDPCGAIWNLRSHRNELVCFASGKVDFFVCHLPSGEHAKLQNMHRFENLSHIPVCELGCCEVSGQIKVLVLVWYEARRVQQAKIQTLGDGEWRSAGDAPVEIWRGGCFLNGSSHWLYPDCIWSFDFGKEEFSQIPLPDGVGSVSYKKRVKSLSTFESCLCLTCSLDYIRNEIDIWIMKEYGEKDSWVKQFVIMESAWTVPVMHMHKGKILLKRRDELCLYDPQTHVSKALKLGARWAS